PAVPPDRTGGTETRATLEEQQPRQVRVRLARRDDLAREHLDVPAVGTAVVQRDTERVVGQHGARLAVARHVPTVRPGPAIRPLYGVRPGPAPRTGAVGGYPLWWPVFRNHPPGTTLSPVPAATPPPFGS